jgi:fimbrial isopeptide formation D2 family protein/LPXTG-motif cell wall-anchored protein
MKMTRKLLALLLTLTLCTAFVLPAFASDDSAAETAQYSIVIKNASEGHTYEAYQVFAGTLSQDATTLSDVVWGAGVSVGNGITYGNATTAADIAALLTDDNAADFAAFISDYLADTPQATGVRDEESGEYLVTLSAPGYYLVKDQDESQDGEDGYYTKYILQVVGQTEVAVKGDKPSVEKKVKDTDDTANTTTDWQDSADYDIGDTVPYQLTATLGAQLEQFDTYTLVFHDSISSGLTLDADSVKVYVKHGESEQTELTEGFSVVTTGLNDCSLEVQFTDVLAEPVSAQNGDQIIVEYTATLNENAVVGAAGNPNTVKLEYSNNPNSSGDGDSTAETPEDKVIVFTYQVVVDKYVGGTEDKLPGAGFTLYKLVNGTETQVGEELTGDSMTTFTFSGLDDGSYVLKETTVPDGYNKMEDVSFTISATHDVTAQDPKLTGLTGTATNDVISFTTVMTESENSTPTGELTTRVDNYSGSTLPSTGGIGTTIFYVVGGILVVGACVVLVARKRVQHQ